MSRACRIAINVALYPSVTRPAFSDGWIAMMEKPVTIKMREITTIVSISEKPRILRENMNPFFLRGKFLRPTEHQGPWSDPHLRDSAGRPSSRVTREGGPLPLWERPLANPHASSSYGGDGRASKY